MIKNETEFREARFAFMNNQPWKGLRGYDLEKALSDYSSGADMIRPENHSQFFGKTKFTGKTASATIKRMNISPRR